MKEPDYPQTAFFSFIAIVAILFATLNDLDLNYINGYIKLLFSLLSVFFCIWLIYISHHNYKDKLELASRCTVKDMAKIKFIGLESRNTETKNNIFMILTYHGNERRYHNINEEIRINFSKGDDFPVYINPYNPAEFVYNYKVATE